MVDFDLIVVGSGPAGAAAAHEGRKAGLSVALVDKAKFPRNKLCGGLFTGRSETAMSEIFGLAIDPEIFLTTDHIRFSSNGEVLADIRNAPPMHLMMRRVFDARLNKAALDAGAEAFTGDGAQAIDSNKLTLKSGRELTFKCLIGADGVSSTIAKLLFGRSFNPETIGFGLEIESPLSETRDNAVEVDFDAATWGYGWAFPKRKSVTVGVGGINSRNESMKANMAAYVSQTESDGDLRYKGQYLPFGDYRRLPGKDNILLAGDAAGLVDPITGEGIALAMESGALAAQSVATAIAASRPETAFSEYQTAIKPIQKGLDQARAWRLVIFPEATHPYFIKAFARGSELQMKYLDLLAGKASYDDLRGAFLQRIPKLAWRFAKHRLGFKAA